MPTAISLQGTLLNRAISAAEIETIRSAKSMNDVSSIWGKIADWFCGTKKEEAKAALFNMINNQGNALEEFKCLRRMASNAYKDRFEISVKNNNDADVKLSLSIKIGNEQSIDIEDDFTLNTMKAMCRKPSESEIKDLGKHMVDIENFSQGLEKILYKERHTTKEENGKKVQRPLINLWRNEKYDDVLKNEKVVAYIKSGVNSPGMMEWLNMAL